MVSATYRNKPGRNEPSLGTKRNLTLNILRSDKIKNLKNKIKLKKKKEKRKKARQRCIHLAYESGALEGATAPPEAGSATIGCKRRRHGRPSWWISVGDTAETHS